MASAVDCGDKEMQVLEAPESNVTLNNAERMELIAVMKEKRCLWGSEKYTRQDKKVALNELEEAFNLRFTSNKLLSIWKSLHAFKLREVKKTRKEPETRSTWKFYQAMFFLKPTLLSSSSQSTPSIKRSKLTKF